MAFKRLEKTTTEIVEHIKINLEADKTLEIKRTSINGKPMDIRIIVRRDSMYSLEPSVINVSIEEAEKLVETLSVFLNTIG